MSEGIKKKLKIKVQKTLGKRILSFTEDFW